MCIRDRYSSLASPVLLFNHFLIFSVFFLIASFTSSFHHGVCLFLVPPTHLLPSVSYASSFITSCNLSSSTPLLKVSCIFCLYFSLSSCSPSFSTLITVLFCSLTVLSPLIFISATTNL